MAERFRISSSKSYGANPSSFGMGLLIVGIALVGWLAPISISRMNARVSEIGSRTFENSAIKDF